jgi:hypothetical protein
MKRRQTKKTRRRWMKKKDPRHTFDQTLFDSGTGERQINQARKKERKEEAGKTKQTRTSESTMREESSSMSSIEEDDVEEED